MVLRLNKVELWKIKNIRKKFIVSRDNKGRFIKSSSTIISKKKYSRKEYLSIKSKQTLQKEIIRKAVQESLSKYTTIKEYKNVREVSVKQNIERIGIGKISLGIKPNQKNYRYVLTAIDPNTRKPAKFTRNGGKSYDNEKYKGTNITTSGYQVGLTTRTGIITDEEGYKNAYENFYARISANFIGYSDIGEGVEIAKRKGWDILEEIVYYEPMQKQTTL